MIFRKILKQIITASEKSEKLETSTCKIKVTIPLNETVSNSSSIKDSGSQADNLRDDETDKPLPAHSLIGLKAQSGYTAALLLAHNFRRCRIFLQT